MLCPEEQKKNVPSSEENVPNFEDQREGFRFSHVQVPEVGVFETNFYFTAYRKFAKEHNDSMGFDVEHFFPKQVGKLLSVKPVILSPSKKLFEVCRTALQSVLHYLDEKNEHSLLLVRIVKANYRSDFRFFVTFEAKTKDEGLIEEYQSVIFHQLDHDQTALHMFRKKGAVKGAVKYDCREKYCFDSIGGAKESEFESKDAFIEYRKYAKEHDDSEGFDIKYFPRLFGDLPMMLKPVRKFNSSLFEDCKMAIQKILEYLKTKNERDLVLIRILKANYRSDFRFFVTFEAKAFVKGEIMEYQSVFDHHHMHGKIALHMFRKKGDVKGAVKYDWRAGGYNFCRIGGAVESDFKSNEAFIAYQRYAKEHDDSEGFDIKHFVSALSGGLWSILLPVRKSETLLFEECKTAIQNVLEYLKIKDEKSLELVNFIKANYCANYLFYVTFEAKSKDSREPEVYQSVIYHNSFYGKTGETCLQMFRIKGEKLNEEEVLPAFDDERDEYEFVEVRNCTNDDFENFDDFCRYEKYVKEHNESEGFDIKTVIGFLDGDCSRTLMPVQVSDTPTFRHCEKAVEIVLHHLYSMNEENLELVRVIRANYKEPFVFFITFKAKNKDTGKVNVYQSVISYNGRLAELNLFRKKRRARRTKST
ncbi:hypothetical protein M5689_020361 [Euphorbia peplus]|nr:hypothetical protein M5689_020361 [Euphorbia peplus]